MKNKVVFLDRDGTLNSNSNHYYIFKPEDVHINYGVYEGLQMLQEAGFHLVIITNQGGISKGKYTIAQVNQVHNHLMNLFIQHNIHIDGIYFCPHHDSLENCLCRKPKSLMLERAIYLHQADIARSYFIGDSPVDMECCEQVGIKGLKINRDENIVPYCNEIVSEKGI